MNPEEQTIPTPIICGRGITTPKYVRSVNLTNTTEKKVTVHVVFESNKTAPREYIFEPNHTEQIEQEINHGSWNACDPILSMTVCTDDTCYQKVFQAQGVECLLHSIVQQEGGLLFIE